jgi:hypothetical protein
MIPEDEGISTRRRASPNVRRLKSSLSCCSKVGDENLVIDFCTALTRPEMFHRIKIGDVDSLLLGRLGEVRGIFIVLVISVVFLDVHAEDANIQAVHLLKEGDGLLLVIDLGWRPDEIVRLGSHSEMIPNNSWDNEVATAVRDNSDCYSLVCIRDTNHTILYLAFDEGRDGTLSQGIGTKNILVDHSNRRKRYGDVRSANEGIAFGCFFCHDTLLIDATVAGDRTAGTEVGCLGVNRSIVHGTDLVDADVAVAAVDPCLCDFLFVLSLQEILFVAEDILVRGIRQDWRKISMTPLTKLVASVLRNIVGCALADLCTGAIVASTDEQRRLMSETALLAHCAGSSKARLAGVREEWWQARSLL